jgi:hypothetical protein
MRWLVAITLVILSTLPVQAGMIVRGSGGAAPTAISHGNDNSAMGGSGGGYGALTFTHVLSKASGNNRLVVVGTAYEQATLGDMSCTYDGDAMTMARQDNTTSGYQETTLFYLLDSALPATAGTYNVACTMTYQETELHVYAMEFYNVAQQAPEDSQGYNSTSSQTATATLTASAGALVLGIGTSSTNTDTWSGHGADQAGLEKDNDNSTKENISAIGWKVVSGAGSASITHTASTGGRRQAASGLSFAPAE